MRTAGWNFRENYLTQILYLHREHQKNRKHRKKIIISTYHLTSALQHSRTPALPHFSTPAL